MDADDWSTELGFIAERGYMLAPGLTNAEIDRAQSIYGFEFPADLRSFLMRALPIGGRFPDWRSPSSSSIIGQMDWPFEGIAFDIEQNAFWWEPWGPRPPVLEDALAIARSAVARAPKLIPICGHRYLPSEPSLPGNPVFSAYQTDIIYYGLDLRKYFACEFGMMEHGAAVQGEARRIRFWTDLVDANC
jgi:hypothetical protein